MSIHPKYQVHIDHNANRRITRTLRSAPGGKLGRAPGKDPYARKKAVYQKDLRVLRERVEALTGEEVDTRAG
jgi:hypothetical protein